MNEEQNLPAARRPPLWVLLGLVLVIAVNICQSWRQIAPFDGVPADGPFQLYNALRRLDAGQLPGRDFPAFHGLGLPVAHYPIYRMFGQDLFASELARELVTRLVAVIVYFAVSWLLVRDFRLGLAWCILGSIRIAHLDGLLNPFGGEMGRASNSLYGLRSSLPLLAIGVIAGCRSERSGTLFLAVVISAAWLIGIEQGMALAVSAMVTGTAIAMARFRQPSLRGVVRPAIAAILAGVMLVVGLTALYGWESFTRVMGFYAIDLKGDQIWYFGVPPNTFFGDGSGWSRTAGIRLLVLGPTLLIGWLAFVASSRWQQSAHSLSVRMAAAVGFGYGLLSLTTLMGMTNMTSYPLGAARMLAVLGTAWLYSCGLRTWADQKIATSRLARPARWLASAAMASLLVLYLVRQRPYLEAAGLSERWDSSTTAFVNETKNVIPEPRTGDIWSTYAGLLEARLGVFHPRQDYIIHALGRERAHYLEAFIETKPQFVQTQRPSTFAYENWLRVTSWPFYERLLLNYRIAATSSFAFLWHRTAGAWREPPEEPATLTNLPSMDGGNTWEVPLPPGDNANTIAVIRVEYRATPSLRGVPLLGDSYRFLASVEGQPRDQRISLPPREVSWQFPLTFHAKQPLVLRFHVEGPLAGGDLRIESVGVRYLTLPPENLPFLEPLMHNEDKP